jgi:hypothetical protein
VVVVVVVMVVMVPIFSMFEIKSTLNSTQSYLLCIFILCTTTATLRTIPNGCAVTTNHHHLCTVTTNLHFCTVSPRPPLDLTAHSPQAVHLEAALHFEGMSSTPSRSALQTPCLIARWGVLANSVSHMLPRHVRFVGYSLM